MTENAKETKGLKVENQTKGLKNVNNGEVNNNDTTVSNPQNICVELQEVLIHSKRDVIIKMLNNILKNVGEEKQLSSKDNTKRIFSVMYYLINNYDLKLNHLLDPEKQSVFKEYSSNDISFGRFVKNEQNEWYFELSVKGVECYLDRKIIECYPNSEWIMEEYWSEYLREHQGITYFENKSGRIDTRYFNENDQDFELLCPIHQGFTEIKNLKSLLKNYTDFFEEEEKKGNTMIETNSWYDQYLNVEKTYNLKSLKWNGLVKNVRDMSIEQINNIDRFSHFYFNLVD